MTPCPESVTKRVGGGVIVRLVRTLAEPGVFSPEDVERLVKVLPDRCRRLPVVLLYLHGTHARGTQSALSDLDLAVLLEPQAARNRRIHADVSLALEETCERDDVDMVILNTAGPIIADRVIRQGRLVYARDDKERITFEASVIKKWHFTEGIFPQRTIRNGSSNEGKPGRRRLRKRTGRKRVKCRMTT